MNATDDFSIMLHRFLKAYCPCVRNIIVSFRLTAILHQRHLGHNHKDEQANASVRAAFVHALGDVFQSISVLISALIIYFKVCLGNHSNPKTQIQPILAACADLHKPLQKVKANKYWSLNILQIPKSYLYLFESFKKVPFDTVLKCKTMKAWTPWVYLDGSNGWDIWFV